MSRKKGRTAKSSEAPGSPHPDSRHQRKGESLGVSIASKRLCRTCQAPLQPSTGNRPREFCSAECRNARGYLAAFVKSLGRVRLTAGARSTFKSELFQISNTLEAQR